MYQKIAGQGGGHATAYDNIIRGVGTNAVLDSLSTLTISYSDVSGPGTYPVLRARSERAPSPSAVHRLTQGKRKTPDISPIAK